MYVYLPAIVSPHSAVETGHDWSQVQIGSFEARLQVVSESFDDAEFIKLRIFAAKIFSFTTITTWLFIYGLILPPPHPSPFPPKWGKIPPKKTLWKIENSSPDYQSDSYQFGEGDDDLNPARQLHTKHVDSSEKYCTIEQMIFYNMTIINKIFGIK